jgi:uncharacterized protein (TIGR02118 family)
MSISARRARRRVEAIPGRGGFPRPAFDAILAAQQEQQMIKFNVMYPNTPGVRFDHAYYRDKHMPLVAQRLGSACLYYTIDQGLAGGAPGAPSPFVASCSVFCDSVETLQRALGPHVGEIMTDIKNYTDAQPVIWISDVVVERS